MAMRYTVLASWLLACSSGGGSIRESHTAPVDGTTKTASSAGTADTATTRAASTNTSGTGTTGDSGVSATGATGSRGANTSSTGGTATSDNSTSDTGGDTSVTGSTATTGGQGEPSSGCTPAPSALFETTSMAGGPGGAYTIHRPINLGEGGFLHPPVAWGNGLGTIPSLYAESLDTLAANGFVVIGNPGPGSDPQVVRQGLEWLIDQNNSGEYAGMLAVDCAGTIGYSMGGGAAVGSGAHPAVKAIVSIHGLEDAAEAASGPILLLTAEGDTFVTKSGYAQPCYDRSNVQPTMLASHAAGDHLDPLLPTAEDWAPALGWLRYWLYGDESTKSMFFGADCSLCSWPDVQRKNHPEW